MAYLDSADVFSRIAAFPAPVPEDFMPTPADLAGFDHTEWAVIALARHDGLKTLHEPRRSRIADLFMGRPRAYQLTDQRLEVLRRLAVEAWRRPLAISLAALGAFIAAGFSSAQLALLLSATGALTAMADSHAPARTVA